ncbi:FliM/FliN family flagellar motor switch protein [Noviherbaspirillum pedocola]|uniref:FliM/FliN family flagellar motor switch protein n=1 Tax=Noviherbaspirillum pedocola TaxID=2801341 RepID=A0A934SZQ5_9BURK|nr:FliM/FliN family flagellar motor C-terminal domain-containing protein [Noviherbaspirillum pedocola]MBK4735704.1 FliM/FliN family flagellar motor switch protein [Noviherbaspirillum pedocola]
MRALPWKLYASHELDAIAASLAPRVQAWGAAWLPGVDIRLAVDDSLVRESPPVPPSLLAMLDEESESATLAFHARAIPAPVLNAAASALGAPTSASAALHAELRNTMASLALRDLLARLMGLPPGSERKPALFRETALAGPVRARGAASLWLTLWLGQEPWLIWMAQPPNAKSVTERSEVRPEPLAPRLEALQSRRIRLRVVAGEASLPLSELMRLGHGDVVLLDHRIDAAMRLENAAGTALAGGYLGLSGDKPVLQLDAAS